MEKNNIGISLVVVTVIAAGLLWFGGSRAGQGAAPHTGAFVAGSQSADRAYDFGSVRMADGKVTHRFPFKNETDKPLSLARLYTSCMCTEALIEIEGEKTGPFGMPGHGFIPALGKTLASGEEVVIEVVFDPAAHGPAGIGRIERAVTLETDLAPVQFIIAATVTP